MSPWQPASAALRLISTDAWVLYVPVPATTTPRSPAASTAALKSATFSALDKVGDSPVVPETTTPSDPVAAPPAAEDVSDEGFEPASLSEAIPDEGAEVGGVAEEDALARLVREAMQEAVDSARKND